MKDYSHGEYKGIEIPWLTPVGFKGFFFQQILDLPQPYIWNNHHAADEETQGKAQLIENTDCFAKVLKLNQCEEYRGNLSGCR